VSPSAPNDEADDEDDEDDDEEEDICDSNLLLVLLLGNLSVMYSRGMPNTCGSTFTSHAHRLRQSVSRNFTELSLSFAVVSSSSYRNIRLFRRRNTSAYMVWGDIYQRVALISCKSTERWQWR
jgi:hypothetical protein